jgi:hypothetical protein
VTAQFELSVVLPCLDEAKTVGICVEKAFRSMAEIGVDGEVIVADNGSQDGSPEIAGLAGARVIDVPVRGYGAALIHGIESAHGRYVVMADADDSYDLGDLGPFVEALREGSDLVMGNRFRGGVAPGAMPPLNRYLGNPVLSFLGRLFFRVPVGDFHCGIRGFRRDRILELNLQTSGMEFASEMVVRAATSGLKITEVPTTLRPAGRDRPPHLRPWSDGWRHLRFLLALSPRWLLLYPSVLLTVSGLLVLAFLAAGPRTIGSVGFGVHTMLAAATAVVVGVQTGGLAVIARAYGTALGLLPHQATLEATLQRVTLNRGVVTGVVMAVLGVVCFVVALAQWESTGFGELDAATFMRLPILGLVLIVTGVQVVLVSFVLSMTRIGEP